MKMPLALLCVPCLLLLANVRAADLRDDYNTSSIAAAQAIHQAMQLEDEQKISEALDKIDEALKADPSCAFAFYIKGHVLSLTGKIDESIECYKASINKGTAQNLGSTVDAMIHLGILHGQLGKFDDSARWFSKVFLADPNDQCKMIGKAYRNMSVTLTNQNRFASAYLAALMALARDPNAVKPEILSELMNRIREGDETVQLLYLDEPAPAAAPRAKQGPIAAGPSVQIPEHVTQLICDPSGPGVVAIVQSEKYYYRILPDAKLIRVDVGETIRCASLCGADLYLVAGQPMKLLRTVLGKGDIQASFPLRDFNPASVAVFPRQQMAFFPGKAVVALNMKTGILSETEFPAKAVAADPKGRFLYTFNKGDPGASMSLVIVRGEPMIFENGANFDWNQTVLGQYYVLSDKLTFSGMRLNAAANGQRLGVSPDGKWVAVAGGGGWRPSGGQTQNGYGVAVFGTSGFSQLQGFFAAEAYPAGVAFNPVTSQVVVLREADAHVYPLSDAHDAQVLKGRFAGEAAWSGDGSFLVIASEKSGVAIYGNPLSGEEKSLSLTWWKSLTAQNATPAGGNRPVAKEIASFKTFAVRRDKKQIDDAFASARNDGLPVRPMNWREFDPYDKDEAATSLADSITPAMNANDRGMLIYKLRQAAQKNPNSPPLCFLICDLTADGKLGDPEENLVRAIHLDAGRTNLSVNALASLIRYFGAKKDNPAALYCAASALFLDRSNSEALKFAADNGYAKAMPAAAGATGSPTVPATASKWPALQELKNPPAKALTASDVFNQAADAVVLISTANSRGSGFCIGASNLIVTNYHVIEGAVSVEVQAFVQKRGKWVRLPAMTAKPVLVSREQDLAVLQLNDDLGLLTPLPVAAKPPMAGDKVFAIGNPGMGDQVLEHTITEGIVSAQQRILDGLSYLQHSAAINPGNSGGPLLNDKGEIVGVVTLKARLENVGFAIPIDRLRAFYDEKK